MSLELEAQRFQAVLGTDFSSSTLTPYLIEMKSFGFAPPKLRTTLTTATLYPTALARTRESMAFAKWRNVSCTSGMGLRRGRLRPPN